MKVVHYQDVPLEEVKEKQAKNMKVRWLIKKEEAPNFAMRLFEIAPGGYSPFHRHPEEHEVFVIEGKGMVEINGEKKDFSRGWVIYVPPEAPHYFKNTGDEILKFLCLIPKL